MVHTQCTVRREQKTFGEQIKALRARRGLTQAELAARCGVALSYVKALETNARRPSPTMLDRLAAVLGARAEVRLVATRRCAARGRRWA